MVKGHSESHSESQLQYEAGKHDLRQIMYPMMSAMLVVFIAYIIALWVARRKRKRLPADGLFTLGTWPTLTRAVISFLWTQFFLAPFIIFLSIDVFAVPLTLAEGWEHAWAYEYVMSNLLGLGPFHRLIPTTLGGKLIDLMVSTGMSILGTYAMSLSGNMHLTAWMGSLFKDKCGGFFLMNGFIYCALTCTYVIGGFMLLPFEDQSYGTIVQFSAGLMTGLEGRLTRWHPQTLLGVYISALICCIQLSCAGAVVVLASTHAQMISFNTLLEGTADEDTQDDSEQEPTAFELTVSESVKKLGIRLASYPPHRVFVEGVKSAAWAATQGVQAGDELVKIEGTSCVDLNEEDFKAALEIRPLRLAFMRAAYKKQEKNTEEHNDAEDNKEPPQTSNISEEDVKDGLGHCKYCFNYEILKKQLAQERSRSHELERKVMELQAQLSQARGEQPLVAPSHAHPTFSLESAMSKILMKSQIDADDLESDI